jgi:hypothetical protein
MSTIGLPRFDESLSSSARSLPLGEVSLAALVGAALLFVWLERRGRSRWADVPLSLGAAPCGPYRSSEFVAEHLRRAPLLVRSASFASLAFGHLFGPLILLALVQYPFDGIAIPLVPGVALVALNWCSAWLLLARSPHAESAARTGAIGSLMANVGLLGVAAAHFVAVELQRRDGVAHACSSSVTFVVIVFALASITQSLWTLAALRAHGGTLTWNHRAPDDAGPSPPSPTLP